VLTAVAVAPKVALAAPAAIVTEAGTVTALLLFDKLTVVAVVAAALSVTVQESVAAPVNELLLQRPHSAPPALLTTMDSIAGWSSPRCRLTSR